MVNDDGGPLNLALSVSACFDYHRSMRDTNDTLDIAAAASLLGEPTRARMLAALMDGRALTATELALEGEVTASTASSHLARLTEAGLLATERQGRHRYFRIADRDVARVVEGLMSIASRSDPVATGPRQPELRRARVCYDHLAGETAVRLLDRLVALRYARQLVRSRVVRLSPRGEAFVERLEL